MTDISSDIEPKPVHYSGRLLTRNVFYSIMGQSIPLIVALVTTPVIVHGLGTERFGVLTLAWMAVGYFSLFDMGIGRATTKFVAEYIARGEFNSLPQLIWTSIAMLLGLGLLGGLVIAMLTPWLVNYILKIPPILISETTMTFYVLALSVPFVLGTSGVRGVLEAQQRFGLVNAIKTPASITSFIVPVLILPFSNNLYHIVAVLVISRFLVFLIYLYCCITSLPILKQIQLPSILCTKELLKFGGWLTVSNIISPFMAYMDRFIIGSMLSMSAVAYYVTPYDLVTKLWIISGSLLGVLFPVFSSYSVNQKEKISLLFERTVKYLLVILSPIVFFLIVLAEPFLEIWLGHEFAAHSTLVLQILSIGALICALAQVPLGAIQAMGRPDFTAKLHLFELPLYLVMMWFFIPKFGIVGAALAWLLRIIIDTIFLFGFYYYAIPEMYKTKGSLILPMIGVIGAMLLSAFITTQFPSILLKILVLSLCTISFMIYSWKILLDFEKIKLRSFISSTNYLTRLIFK